MADAKQQTGSRGQDRLDDDYATRPTDLGEVDDSSTDEISASMNVVSGEEELRQGRQGSGEDNGLTASSEDDDSPAARQGIDDEISFRDELRPKDGSMGVTTDVDVDAEDEDSMPTGLPKKPGYEDYNPAARPHVRAGDSSEDAATTADTFPKRSRPLADSSMPANPSPS